MVESVVAGNVYDKYGTTHPIARRLMAGFERDMARLLERAGTPSSVLEVGCGEGHVTAQLARRYPAARVVGSDVSSAIVAEARALHPGLCFQVGSIYDVGAEPCDLVVACEVLEHLDEPGRALDALARATRGHLFVSVPREPLWRALNLARGRYVRDLGNTPGHVQHWSRAALLALLGRRFEVVAVRTPLPWTQALCRCRP
jgi:2-polyprenyl-3-methyl-5-hydroxy-6-metoxy-1,4-benzoquinol methylase